MAPAGGDLRFAPASSWADRTRRAAAHLIRRRHVREGHYHTLFETAPYGVLIADAETKRLLYANPAICRMLGYQADELMAMSVSDIHPPADLGRVIADFDDQVRGEKILALDVPCLRKDGTVVYKDVTGRMIQVAGRSCNLGFFADPSVRPPVERQHELLMSAIEQAAEAVVITDHAGTIVYVNPAFERVTGYTRAEAVGQNPRILKSGQHDDSFYKELWQTITRGDTWNGRMFNKRKNGEIFTEEATISPVRDAAGRVAHYVAVKRDMSREFELEEQLLQSRKMEAIGLLAGGVAHDFNNLLQTILGYTDIILADTGLPATHRQDLKQVYVAATRASVLTRQLLAFGSRQAIQPVPIDLNALTAGFLAMLRRAIGDDIKLDVAPGTGLWTVMADEGQVESVLMNLCFNARDAMPKGGRLAILTANVTLDQAFCLDHPWAHEGPFVRLTVSDTGCGMTTETLQQAFDPFFTTKKAGKGTGLGLSMVYGIVRQHKGIIHVESTVGQGSTFHIFLPALPDSPPLAELESSTSVKRGNETILLAEDDETVRALASRILKQAGYTVLAASDGEDALRVLERHSAAIRLALLDVVMPKLGGALVARFIRANHPEIKILFASGYSQDAVDGELDLDAEPELLEKPYEVHELLHRVRRMLDR